MKFQVSLHESKNTVVKLMPSLTFAKRYFRKNYGYNFDEKNPKTFNEKLWWLHIFNRDPLTTICTDKVLAREYVKSCGLEHILNEVYAVYNHPKDITLEELPNEFFLKCNHLSNGNIWCKNKEEFPIKEVKDKLSLFMKKNYYWNSREWNYKNIVPKIMCEKVLIDEQSKIGLVDYRFFCFEGKVKFLAVDIETTSADGTHYAGAKRNIYDLGFNNMKIKLKRPNFDEALVEKPKNFKSMIEYAEKLSNPFVACRVDFYNIDGEIIFGEITFHQGGAHDITPYRYQEEWGDLINLKSDKIVVNEKTKKKYKNVLEK
ncbi:ATP-grasp fold amidoligase family protein [Planomicrobium sp. YIM 101495]|uniref:ATP-grasp fold amidoligase family protein n=1 Tax=Planomicrobium sp. YIM 101495 TaxID=2665160 RepID=UPI0012B932C8|nr:ATP-grasp fold amidoligase family protein [Planomicrobium sp. YIM 101495]MTD30764.1 carboxylate--amine ligase [Planomicrobium sp. YIM 101495]